jgi:hypothetical protein
MKRPVLIAILLLIIHLPAAAAEISWQSAIQSGGTGDAYVTDMISGLNMTVPLGVNRYLIGYFTGSVSFGSVTLNSNGMSDIFIAKADNSGNWVWAKSIGGTQADLGFGICRDNQGNLLVTGSFRDRVNFGATSLRSAGETDIFIAKLDASGNFLWAIKFGDEKFDSGLDIASDNEGNCYVTGEYSRIGWDYDNRKFTNYLQKDLFAGKWDANGERLWTTFAGSLQVESGLGIAVAADGNVFITGNYYGNIHITPYGKSETIISYRGGSDIYLAKLDSSGNWLWMSSIKGTGDDKIKCLALDSSGNIYLSGTLSGEVSILDYLLTVESEDATDTFVLKLSPDLKDFRYQRLDTATGAEINSLCMDGAGNCYVTGSFVSSLAVGNTTLTAAGLKDVFLAVLDKELNWKWAERIGGPGDDRGCCLSYNHILDREAWLSLAGNFSNSITFGDKILSSNGNNVFLVTPVPPTPQPLKVIPKLDKPIRKF